MRGGRARDIVSTLDALVEDAARARGWRVARVQSADQVDEAQRQSLSEALARLTGDPVELQVTIDPALLGGVVVQVGDLLVDSSTRHRLDELKEHLHVSEAAYPELQKEGNQPMAELTINADEITAALERHVDDYTPEVGTEQVGRIVEVGDGIARITGLPGAAVNEILEFEDGTEGLALNLDEETIGAVILGDDTGLEEEQLVKATGRILSVRVGDALLGRVVNALGEPIDGKGPIATDQTRRLEVQAPGIVEPPAGERAAADRHQGHRRHDPDRPGPARADHRRPQDGQDHRGRRHHPQPEGPGGEVHLRGHRPEGLVGGPDGGHPRSATAPWSTPWWCWPRRPTRPRSSTWPPTAGCAMGQHWMENGEHALIVYDDLSKQAEAYRQMSLLLRRPPGREAYPGDVFYLHSRLLERAAKLSDEDGGGSLTALPIIETKAGDVSAYIPTNVISITDGQVFLESDLFYAGVRPAINVGISVSRVGSAAQIKAMKAVAGTLKLDLAQFRELEAFATFGSELDKVSQAQLDRGYRLTELLKQGLNAPVPVEEQVLVIFAGSEGYVDDIPVSEVQRYESEVRTYFRANHADLLDGIRTTGQAPRGRQAGDGAPLLHRRRSTPGRATEPWPAVRNASCVDGSRASSRPRRSPRPWS